MSHLKKFQGQKTNFLNQFEKVIHQLEYSKHVQFLLI